MQWPRSISRVARLALPAILTLTDLPRTIGSIAAKLSQSCFATVFLRIRSVFVVAKNQSKYVDHCQNSPDPPLLQFRAEIALIGFAFPIQVQLRLATSRYLPIMNANQDPQWSSIHPITDHFKLVSSEIVVSSPTYCQGLSKSSLLLETPTTSISSTINRLNSDQRLQACLLLTCYYLIL